MIDYALWEVTENGATLPKTQVMEEVAGSCRKEIWWECSHKETQRNLLKQQYENFTASSSEMLDQTFDRLQELVSHLELLGEKLSQEDVNQKLLRSLSPEWNTHVVVWRNKADLDTMSMDDLYNNLKMYELEVKGISSKSSSTQNMAFVSSSSNNTSSTNGAVNTAHEVSTASTQVNAAYSTNIYNFSNAIICSFSGSQPNSPQLVHEDLEQIHPDDMKEMDLRWQMAMLTMRARSDQAEEGPNYALMAFSSLNFDSKFKQAHRALDSDNCKKGLGYENYNTVPPPYTRNFMPPTPDLSFTGLDEFVNKLVVKNCKAKSGEEEPKVVRKNDDVLIIEEWVSNNEEEDVSQSKIEKKTVRPSIAKIEFVKSKQQKKNARKTIKQVEQHRKNTHSLRGNQRN
uniref:Uncharacterized protein n=1 Tax=Tanacetum cinerariifolium TaxID=118510 RepID=A0A6L2K448_TANCI|nr:hypothetical protein [Tanacetum cinerariifolium]